VFVLYAITLAPSTAMWDTSEYIAAAYTFGLPHPPGNPFFVIIGRFFSIIPIATSVAARINVLAALSSAAAAAMWFLVTERVLTGWFHERWQRILGGVLGALIGATAFTVWNQSVVNEKVYTVSLVGIAVIAWLTVRWSDEPDGRKADRTLVLISYLLGLGYANHMAGMLAAPAVALAVLIRALVTTSTASVLGGDPGPRPPSEVLRAAYWRAARDGWSGSGVDALTGRILPARVQAERLLDHVRPALEEHGDTELVTAFLRRLATHGSGAERQRASAARHGSLMGVVDDLVDVTAPSAS
jgi:hypothetical protein